jgi:hypothetical protein
VCPEGHNSRSLIWVERKNAAGWGCSECGWVFTIAGPLIDESLDEMKRHFQIQLDEEFASHNCAEHPSGKGASP